MSVRSLPGRGEHPGKDGNWSEKMTLSCPSCGLVLALKGPQVEYCPRCIARRRQPVPLIAEALKHGRRHTGRPDGAGPGPRSVGPGDAPG
jgi:hypothetical protein